MLEEKNVSFFISKKHPLNISNFTETEYQSRETSDHRNDMRRDINNYSSTASAVGIQ